MNNEQTALFNALTRSAIFGAMDEDSRAQLASSGMFIKAEYEAGESVMPPTEGRGGYLGLVVSGRLRVSRDDDSREVTLNILTSGGNFGASTMFSDGDASLATRITAMTAARADFIEEKDFRSLLRDNGDVALAYIRFLSGRIRFLNRKVRAFSGSTAAEKTAQALISTADADGVCENGCCAELARMLNIGRASLYRALDAMESERLISRDGKRITVLDFDRLSRFR